MCGVCGKGFSLKRAWPDTRGALRGEAPRVRECGRGFNRKSTLIIHGDTLGEKPHMCGECGREASARSPTSSSTGTHSGESPYVCQECGKDSARSQRRQARRTHLERRPSCAVTAGWASATGPASSHTRGHSGRSRTPARGVGCFRQRSTHFRQPPEDTLEGNSCVGVCGHRFSQNSTLISHRRTHTPGEKPYVCRVCGGASVSVPSQQAQNTPD